jgi:hypothetical protein
MKIATKARCVECLRVFDLLDEEQARGYYYGHDCEAESMAHKCCEHEYESGCACCLSICGEDN